MTLLIHYININGVMWYSTCTECTHKYKKTADVIPEIDEPQNLADNSQEIDSNAAAVTMVVVDGIVMGPML